MPKQMSAKDMFFDFLTMAVAIALFSFCFFYFIVAGHWAIAEKITRAAAFASMFGLAFVLKLKTEKHKAIKLKKEDSLDDILVYFSENDKIKDFVVCISLPFFIGALAWYDYEISAIDQVQMVAVFLLVYAWHRFVFRKKADFGDVMCATVYDRIKDQIFIYFLPVFSLVPPLFASSMDTVDLIQAIMIFGIMYFWHKYLIRKKE